MLRWRASRASQITLIALALLTGVMVGRLWLAAATAAIAVVAIVMMVALQRLGLLLALVFAFGVWRAATTTFVLTPLGQRVGQTVTVTGVIIDDPGVNDKNRVSYTIGGVKLDGRPVHQSLATQTNFKVLQRGYAVQVTGKLRQGLGATPASMAFGSTAVLSTHTGPIEQLRQHFFTAIRAVLPEPLSGFGLGLLIGVRALIDKPLQATLNAVGLSHLVAVSGYNLTIIIQAARRVLSRVSTFTVTAVSLWMIFGFMVVAGFGASIVRAALVSVLSIGISYYGYEPRPITLIAVPAFVTVAWKPDYLLNDVGWQLSFLAFFGIMVLAPLLERRFVRRPTMIKLLVVESLAAQITTAPLILGLFGNLSLVSPLSNAVILPLVPLSMLLSFATGAAAALLPAAGAWIAIPTAGLLGLMIGLIQWFATWPDANLQLGSTPAMVIGMYGLIGLGMLALRRSASHSPASSD